MSNDNEDRLRRIEERLIALEQRLGTTAPPPVPPAEQRRPTPIPGPAPTRTAGRTTLGQESLSATNSTPAFPVTALLGWGGVGALVLAAVYLIQLAIDSGFLTPMRQVALAGLFGVGLIVTGLVLRENYRRISALLPAGGVAIMYITVYGAHLYHGLIGPLPAMLGVILVSILAMGLNAIFNKDYFTFFAVIGAYTGPFLLHILAARPVDLVIYFGAWDILFCIHALRAKRRSIYLVAAYLAFVVFDATWRQVEYSDWAWAAGFQAVQFLIFLGATVLFSIRNKRALTDVEALPHLPPLLFFYATVYPLLNQHMSTAAPWLALASFVPMIAGYAVAKVRLPSDARAGELIVATYAAVVLFHAGFMELVPSGYHELTGWLLLLAMGGVAMAQTTWLRRFWPLTIAASLAAVFGYLRLSLGIDLRPVIVWEFQIVAYAATLYVGYWLINRVSPKSIFAALCLYAGHLMVMGGAVTLFDSRLTVSVVWGVLAVAALLASITFEDRRLGRSALLVFAAFAAKVMLFDLSGAAPLVRIGSLVVLGVTMYLGSMLYQNIDDDTKEEPAPS